MFKTYIQIALRNFWKNRVFAIINIIGLSIGISAALVIYLIVAYDLGFDKWQKDKDRIYRVVSNIKFPGEDFKNSGVPAPLPEAARKELTGVEATTAFHLYNDDVKVTIPGAGGTQNTFRREPNIIFADEHYFDIIQYKWLSGSPRGLKEPFRVVLTESRMRKFFGNDADPASVMGQRVVYNDSVQTTVAGIVQDLAERTDFTFKEFISVATIANSNLKENYGWGEWGSIGSSSQCLLKLATGTTPQQVNAQFKAIQRKYTDSSNALNTTHALQALSDIHFNSDYDNFDQRQANLSTLYGLLLVGIFLLVLGCINFINLTTAQATQRAKEIGIRKTLGSTKRQLVWQFLCETCLLTLLATLLSIALTPWLLNVFRDFIPEEVHFQPLKETGTLLFLAALTIVVSLLSGFYPALVLARFRPVLVLKNQAFSNTGKTRGAWIRKTLTVSQFVIAQVFIMATIIVSKQISFSLNKELGFKKDAIVYFHSPWRDPDKGKRQVLLEKLRSIPGIQMVSLSGSSPASNSTSSQTMTFLKGNEEKETMVEIKYADTAYFRLYGMKLAAGRFLRASDTVSEYLVNEAYVRHLGFQHPSEVVGQFIKRGAKQVPIAGVLRDFHTKSTHVPIKPLAFSTMTASQGAFHIALDPQAGGDAWQATLKKVETEWKQLYPEEDFKYTFFDESIAAFYKSERNMARLLLWATGLAILISCMGLLGLVIYMTNQRVKEIGIRKVLGASVRQLVALLSKDFLALVLMAFVVAAPLTWWGMYRWLENFVYRTSISWWIFLLGGSGMMLLALFTLSIQTIRSAMTNPVKNLRTE